MTLDEFITLVVEMRRQQRRFFRAERGSSEKRDALIKSQEAERKVDKAIAAFKAPGLEL
jgi:hypothetical protein